MTLLYLKLDRRWRSTQRAQEMDPLLRRRDSDSVSDGGQRVRSGSGGGREHEPHAGESHVVQDHSQLSLVRVYQCHSLSQQDRCS